MSRRLARLPCTALLAALAALAAPAGPAAGQSLVSTRNIEVSFQNQLLRGAILRSEYRPSDFIRDYRISAEPAVPSDSYLAAYSFVWYGYRVEELSPADLALEGLGTGASIGMFVGAIGNTLGLWDEDKAWLVTGAMSALGAAWGASHADDPSWRVRLRWDELDDMTVPSR